MCGPGLGLIGPKETRGAGVAQVALCQAKGQLGKTGELGPGSLISRVPVPALHSDLAWPLNVCCTFWDTRHHFVAVNFALVHIVRDLVMNFQPIMKNRPGIS